MKTLIYADVHDQFGLVERLLDAVPHDVAWCTGDWFDDWTTGPEEAARSAEWIARYKPNSVLGNHDEAYFYSDLNPAFQCSGWTATKAMLIREKLGRPTWPLHVWIDGWLLSHAGVHPYLFASVLTKKQKVEMVDLACKTALENLQAGESHFLLGAGRDRGGLQRVGGITWLDWNSFQCVPELNQIVGHTYNHDVRWKRTPDGNSSNICIDTGFHHYVVIEDGRLEVFETEQAIGKWQRRKRSA